MQRHYSRGFFNHDKVESKISQDWLGDRVTAGFLGALLAAACLMFLEQLDFGRMNRWGQDSSIFILFLNISKVFQCG